VRDETRPLALDIMRNVVEFAASVQLLRHSTAGIVPALQAPLDPLVRRIEELDGRQVRVFGRARRAQQDGLAGRIEVEEVVEAVEPPRAVDANAGRLEGEVERLLVEFLGAASDLPKRFPQPVLSEQ
jgi:hypothetical protein